MDGASVMRGPITTWSLHMLADVLTKLNKLIVSSKRIIVILQLLELL